jgi:hypothetical protein
MLYMIHITVYLENIPYVLSTKVGVLFFFHSSAFGRYFYSIKYCIRNKIIYYFYNYIAVKSKHTHRNNDTLPLPLLVLFLARIIMYVEVCYSTRCITIVHCMHNNFIITHIILWPDIMQRFLNILRVIETSYYNNWLLLYCVVIT